MRMKAHAAGALNSNSQQKIETKQMDGQNVIIIQPANPPVVCVPSYNSIAVYGAAPVYPYPAMVYPPSTGAIVAASAISFGMGVALGAAFSGCCGPSWGWGCNWGPHSTVIVNNNFFGRYGYARPYAAGAAGRAAWAHNPAYRGAVPYSSAAVAGRYGSAAGVRTPYGAAGARDFASGGGRRISFYFLVLTVVPVVRESSDQKAPRVASAAGDVRVPRRVPRTSQLR